MGLKEINEDNLEEFLNHYHYLHDSTFSNIKYDVSDAKIDILINVVWSGEPYVKEDGYYQTNPQKMRMVFEGIKNFNIKEQASWDYIDEICLKYIEINNKKHLCFADYETDGCVYIVCDTIKYEERTGLF